MTCKESKAKSEHTVEDKGMFMAALFAIIKTDKTQQNDSVEKVFEA